jgi:hypothetical protein
MRPACARGRVPGAPLSQRITTNRASRDYAEALPTGPCPNVRGPRIATSSGLRLATRTLPDSQQSVSHRPRDMPTPPVTRTVTTTPRINSSRRSHRGVQAFALIGGQRQ